MVNLLQKLIFRSGILCYHCWRWHWKSIKSFHALFDKYLKHMLVEFEQNRIKRNHTKFCAFWQKVVNNFWQSVDAILEKFLWLKQLFDTKNINSNTIILQCFKNYSTPTREIRLKVAPNMTDPISLNENLP